MGVILIGKLFFQVFGIFFAQFFNLPYFPGFFFQINIGMLTNSIFCFFWRTSRIIVTERLLHISIHISNYFKILESMEKTLSEKNEPKKSMSPLRRLCDPGHTPHTLGTSSHTKCLHALKLAFEFLFVVSSELVAFSKCLHDR